jgi:hypothetical protein
MTQQEPSMTATASLISLSGAALRAMNTPEAQAEITRRAAKPAKTVAALRSRGDEAGALARIQASKAADKPKAASRVVAFTRTTEVVPAMKRDTIKAVRLEHGSRIESLEQGLLALANTTATINEVVGILAKNAMNNVTKAA